MGTLESRSNRIPKRLYDLPEASEYLGRSVAGVRALVNSGRIPVVRIDRKVQFDIHDLERVIEESKRSIID
jgi:hypothetical protein